MYDEIIKNIEHQLPVDLIYRIKNRNIHLGVFTEPCLTFILDGEKTIESRFSKNKIAPYNQISAQDIVFIKKTGGNVIACFTIKDVLFFNLSETSIWEIKSIYGNELCVNDKFWNLKESSNYATLIKIDKLIRLQPFHVSKNDMQAWVVLHKAESGLY